MSHTGTQIPVNFDYPNNKQGPHKQRTSCTKST